MSQKYALIVANTEYIDSGLARLSAPGKDAEDFARVLRDPGLCAFNDVTILLNQPEHIVRRAIEVYFDKRKPSDLVVFYFSGHGIRDEVGALYLAVKNTVRSRLRSTAIKSDYVREIMDQSRSKRQVLILDCCNSGAFAQGTKAATGGSMGFASAFEGTGYGHVVLTASDSTQFAWEGDQVIGETDNSLFTHFLVKGLEGEADHDGDGTITIDELYDYAYEQIVTRTPKQTPGKWSYKQQGEIILRQSPHIAEIRPARLPADLLAATESTLPYVREGAVKQLGDLLKGRNIALAQAARATLEKMASEDDSRFVASAARKVLDSAEQTMQPNIVREPEPLGNYVQPGIGQVPAKKEDPLLTKKAETVQTPRQSQPQKRQPHATPASLPAKMPERSSKRSTTVWTIVFLTGMALLVYATLNLLSPGPSATSLPTEPINIMQPLMEDTLTPTNTEVPTMAPTTAPLIFTVVVTAPPLPTSTVPPDREIPSDPADFVAYYFENVNNRNYDLTWALLSNAYRARTNPDGKQQYVDFWNGYDKVDIGPVNSSYLTSTYVQVKLNATFYQGSKSTNSPLTYFLSLTGPQGTWLFDIVPDLMCDSSPRKLQVGINARVTTISDPLLLRRTASRNSTELEELPPGTIVSVIGGPQCNIYRSVYFWYWEVRSPSGKTGWVVEGSMPDDPIFIQPVR